jgi:hypothetical protein
VRIAVAGPPPTSVVVGTLRGSGARHSEDGDRHDDFFHNTPAERRFHLFFYSDDSKFRSKICRRRLQI